MRRSTSWFVFAALLAASILISVVGTLVFHAPFLALFLVFPFVPILFRGSRGPPPSMKRCPSCGFMADDPQVAFCPRDGNRLG
jgi:hypothetical protein